MYHERWQGVNVCPVCHDKLVQGTIVLPEPAAEKPSNVRVVKPAQDSWEHRKAAMQVPVSRMEDWVASALTVLGVGFECQREFCVRSTTPDFWFPKQNLAVYLDGPVHEGREDRDDALREQLANRHGVKVVSIPYAGDSAAELERVVAEMAKHIST
jgi:very-short-patch-repair endonuclease